ncbi:MAG: hypothetical protein KDJ69_09070 [Nitratireductor sp.]|nr:hypothetical protein [Nitratireductor sp.]
MKSNYRARGSATVFPGITGAGTSVLLSVIITTALLAGCQSSQSSSNNSTAALQTAADENQAQTSGEVPAEGTEGTAEAQTTDTAPQTAALAQAEATQQPVQQAALSVAPAGQCAIPLPGGPPAKPPRGKDFGRAVVKNTGKAVQRGVIQQIGGALGGGLGAAIAGNVAAGTIRQEEDIKGVWMITDGSQTCACEVSVDSLWKLKGKGADTGHSKTRGCTNSYMQQVAAWQLGYSFTGYDSKFHLKAKDKQTVLATLNRDGIHYFSGTFSDGTPVVMWRQGQTYHQLTKFNQSVK